MNKYSDYYLSRLSSGDLERASGETLLNTLIQATAHKDFDHLTWGETAEVIGVQERTMMNWFDRISFPSSGSVEKLRSFLIKQRNAQSAGMRLQQDTINTGKWLSGVLRSKIENANTQEVEDLFRAAAIREDFDDRGIAELATNIGVSSEELKSWFGGERSTYKNVEKLRAFLLREWDRLKDESTKPARPKTKAVRTSVRKGEAPPDLPGWVYASMPTIEGLHERFTAGNKATTAIQHLIHVEAEHIAQRVVNQALEGLDDRIRQVVKDTLIGMFNQVEEDNQEERR